MNKLDNPFTPNFGEIPRHMAGREQILNDMMRALDRQTRSPELNMLIYGARGTGKTALLALVAEEAQAHGWISVNVGCYPGMLEDIYEQALANGKEFIERRDGMHITGLTVANVFGLEWRQEHAPEGNWRTRMTQVLEELGSLGIGLLITVDEIDPELDEMIHLAAVYQLFVRERRRVGLLMAGLPSKISALVQDKSVSFLRRAKRQPLGRISDSEVSLAVEKTLRDGGREIEPEALSAAVEAIDGFAFMLQLVGYYLWESADGGTIGRDTVEKGIVIARQEMRDRVLEPAFLSLSDGDLKFCQAMLEDGDDSRIADIAQRLGRSPSTVNTYRARLIEQGIIGSARRGYVSFELPLFRDYLEERL